MPEIQYNIHLYYLTSSEKYTIRFYMQYKNIISILMFLPSGNFILQDIFLQMDEIKLHLPIILPNIFPEIQEVSGWEQDGNICWKICNTRFVPTPSFLSLANKFHIFDNTHLLCDGFLLSEPPFMKTHQGFIYNPFRSTLICKNLWTQKRIHHLR